ncbi:MAG: hypothetical protein MJY86_05265 [Bacteroidales bacterium]|nr:hypothetical protein [Bacteroidales bacterium]
MKRFFIAFAVLAAACSCSGPSSVKDVAKKVSDPVFRTYCVAKMDLDGDKAISMAEADSIRTMDVSGLNIKSLKGIEYFKSLKSLDCSQTQVKSLVLDNPSLEILKCEKNEALVKLDVAKCPSLGFIYASHTGIKELDLSAQQNLYRLWVDNTPIKTLGISSCQKLNNLNVESCKNLKELTLSPSVNRDMLYVIKDDGLVVK